MRRAKLVLALALLCTQGGCWAARDAIVLKLPPAHAQGDTLYLEIELGVVGAGQEIEMTTEDGRLLGVVSPHAIRPGRAAGTYTLPLPAEAIDRGRLRVRVNVTRSDAPVRPASEQEVRSLRIVAMPATPPDK